MKTFLLFTAGGPMMILTSHDRVTDAAVLEKLAVKGIDKFIAYELPLEVVAHRYGFHYENVRQDLHETDVLRVLDYSGSRIFALFPLAELGGPIMHEGPTTAPG
jgi:hypothetical protein